MKLDKYLTEELLGDILNEAFSGCNIIEQLRVKTPVKNFVIDYIVEAPEATYVIEFDGNFHYQKTNTQLRDSMLEVYCKEKDFILVEIPYFIQLDYWSSYIFFDAEIAKKRFSTIETTFPHGFISKDIVLPCDYNIAGWNRFAHEMNTCCRKDRESIAADVYNSLYKKMTDSKFQFKEAVLGFDMNPFPNSLTPGTYFDHYPT